LDYPGFAENKKEWQAKSWETEYKIQNFEILLMTQRAKESNMW